MSELSNLQVYEISEKEHREMVDQSPYATPFHEFPFASAIGRHFGREHKALGIAWGQRQWAANIFFSNPYDSSGIISTNIIGYGGPLPLELIDDGNLEVKRVLNILGAIRKCMGKITVESLMYPATVWPASMAGASTCKVPLTDDSDFVFSRILTGNVRTAIRKAQRSGVDLRVVDPSDEESLSSSIHLLNDTQRQVGSRYLTDRELLKTIIQLDDNAVKGQTVLAEKDGQAIGMATYIYNQNELFHLFHGWDRSFSETNVNQLLIWEMVQTAIRHNVPTFNMGSSHTQSLLDAKLRWGGHLEQTPQLRVTHGSASPTQ